MSIPVLQIRRGMHDASCEAKRIAQENITKNMNNISRLKEWRKRMGIEPVAIEYGNNLIQENNS